VLPGPTVTMRLPVADLVPETRSWFHLHPADYQRWAARVRLGWFVDQSRTVLSFSAYAGPHQIQFPGAYNRSPPDFKDEAGGSDEPVEVQANSEFRDPFAFAFAFRRSSLDLSFSHRQRVCCHRGKP
jgi:hypothetical protein